ncbi:MAG: hypothetical protein IT384_18095 [Deltaproteobacteria bacterium]|nr:hypothetical protein [Deltaproteobacteria bacterium]
MANNTALRLYDAASKTNVIVEGGKVYAEKDGRISKKDELSPSTPGYQEFLSAAAYFEDVFNGKVAGVTTADGKIVSGARLDQVELQQFGQGGGTPAKRAPLEQHLTFFDPNATGQISLLDNYRGWRRLPSGLSGKNFSVAAAAKQALGSWAVFSYLEHRNAGASVMGSILGALGTGGKLDIHSINASRPSGSTGIYDPQGNIDEARWAQLEAGLRTVANKDGVMSQAAAKDVLADFAKLGMIPSRQYGSFWEVTAGMNRAETVTIDQLRWLYDGTILDRAEAVSMDRKGKTPQT